MAASEPNHRAYQVDAGVLSQDTNATSADENTAILNEPSFVVRDIEWEAELLTHLSEQEQRLREFSRTRFRKNPYEIAECALSMIRSIDAYSATHAEQVAIIQSSIGKIRSQSSSFLGAFATLQKPSEPRTLFGFTIGSPKPAPNSHELASKTLSLLPATLEAYLLLLGNGFATGHMAAKWVETCGIFMRQLNKLISSITN
jgi:hypothetical protein